MARSVLLVVIALFPISEISLAFVKRSRGRTARSEDRGSMRLIWLGVVLGIGLGIAAELIPAGLPWPSGTIRLVALVLLLGGLALRWTAILMLGRFFMVDIAIRSDHILVQKGPYRYVRHPSYTGLLIAFLGLGVCFDNWLSIVGLLVPVTLAVLNRVRKEEGSLLGSLGPPYADYCARTRRFIPGLIQRGVPIAPCRAPSAGGARKESHRG